MDNQKRKKTGSWINTAMTVICVFLVLVLAVVVAATIYINYRLDQLGTIPNETPGTISSSQTEWTDSTTESVDPELPTLEEDYTVPTIPPVELPEQMDHVVNLMLVGQDRREGQGRQRSDSMVLVTFNTSTKTITLSSFLRDSYVAIPGYNNNRMNAAYVWGGPELLNQVLAVNFGVAVDGNVEVDFSQFQNIVDAIGGIDIELTQSEANYLNRRGLWDVDDGSAGTWNLTAGVNHLTGAQALAYSRIRDIGEDWGRTGRQRKVLSEIVNICREMNIFELNGLLDTVLPMLNTNMTKSQILGHMIDLFPMLSDCTIVSRSVPGYSDWGEMWRYAHIRGMSVIEILDFEKCRAVLQEAMAIKTPEG